MHRLLVRQLELARNADNEIDIGKLLDLVGQAYEEDDQDRRRTDRSITLMIEEVEDLNTRLRASQDLRFRAAIENMSQGLCMFDGNHRLVICNSAYAHLYNLPPRLTEPGTSFWAMLDYCAEDGMVTIVDGDQRRETIGNRIADAKPLRDLLAMANGTIVQVYHEPLQDGGWLSTHEDVTEQRQQDDLILRLARHDSLTGLANRGTFLEAMAEAEDQIAAGKILGVLYIDLDHFKPVNDTLGHAAGDAVLKSAAERIRRCVGKSGMAARLGGDEFAALVGPVSDVREIEAVSERILASIRAPIHSGELEMVLSASIGVAVAPRDGKDTDTLMRNGDLALYRAKSEHRGSVCFYQPEMDAQQKRRHAIELGLKDAVGEGTLQLYFQPLICLADQSIASCEALMRWSSAEYGPVSPDEFIPVAEETGLIRKMGEWALRTACMTAMAWPEDMRVAVNLSSMQFKNNPLVEQVKAALAGSGLPAERLELEITESLLLEDSKAVLETLHALRSLGVRICLDDFGTGFSSLSYLRSFPFDKIKIDRSFLNNEAAGVDNLAIIRAVVELCSSFGMATTIEGIETESQLEAVRSQGCTEVQGFLFSPPLPPQAIVTLLEKTAGRLSARKHRTA